MEADLRQRFYLLTQASAVHFKLRRLKPNIFCTYSPCLLVTVALAYHSTSLLALGSVDLSRMWDFRHLRQRPKRSSRL
jgi:hypothetical protein